jgi:hypothetical protein
MALVGKVRQQRCSGLERALPAQLRVITDSLPTAGLWTAASYFNHSCAPRVHKDRKGRLWNFVLNEPTPLDAELTISYLGEEELLQLNANRRRALLRNAWGFECACARCTAEDAEYDW